MAHRSIAERLEALRLQEARLLKLQAKKELKSHPVIEGLQNRIVSINNNNLKYQRWENEWVEKVANFQQRVAEWQERGKVAKDKMAFVRKQKARIEGFLEDATRRINAGEEVSLEDYSVSANPEAYED